MLLATAAVPGRGCPYSWERPTLPSPEGGREREIGRDMPGPARAVPPPREELTHTTPHHHACHTQRFRTPHPPPTWSAQVYVTHKLRAQGDRVWQLLAHGGAAVFVSGSAKQMPANVVSALEDIACQQGGLGKEEAAKWVRQLELTGRYCVEAWS